MVVHLIDGTYELFRHYHALPSALDVDGREVAAARGVLRSVLGMITHGATHVGVATDHVIESFRNRLWRGYKTSAGVEADLLAQFAVLEDALRALGVVVWPMVEFEADDALAAAAAKAAKDGAVDQVYPGLEGWGAKSSAAVLARFGRLEAIPDDWKQWHVNASNPARLAEAFARDRRLAYLFRDLATLRTDVPVFSTVEDLRWTGPTERFADLAARLDPKTSRPRRYWNALT